MGRNKKTQFEENRGKYRKACDRHVVTFEADMDETMKRHAFAYADDLRVLGNECIAILNRRLDQLFRTKAYRKLQKDYGWHAEHMKDMDEESDEYKKLDAEKTKIGKKMNDMQKEYHVVFDDIRKMAADKAKELNIMSVFARSKAEDINRAVESVLYGDGKHLHFHKRNDLPLLRAKEINRAITMHIDENNELIFGIENIGYFTIKKPKNSDPKSNKKQKIDFFLQDEYKAIVDFLTYPEQENEKVELYANEKVLVPVFRPCYASLKCETIRHKLRVFIQITIAAPPCHKYKKDGVTPRHNFMTKGRVGCDNGSQSFAVVSDSDVLLENTAERNGKSTKENEKLIKKYQREMARSLRKMNPDRLNPDGTYKKGKREKLKKSNHYRHCEYRVHELHRKNALTRKYAIQTDANRIRELGDELIIEPSNAKQLQKRSKKPTETTDKTIEVKKGDKVTTVKKCKKKKRFGRSVLYRCPSAFQADLKKKFGDGYHEVSRKFRASQYDHVLDDYIKKKLSERWHVLPDGKRIQRDVYSAFLMYCSNDDFTSPDRNKCLKKFDSFYKKHEDLIESIINRRLNICNSGISA